MSLSVTVPALPQYVIDSDFHHLRAFTYNPLIISNKNVQFTNAAGSLIRCTLPGKFTVEWDLRNVIPHLNWVFKLTISAWGETFGSKRESDCRYALAMRVKYFHLARNLRVINGIIAEKHKIIEAQNRAIIENNKSIEEKNKATRGSLWNRIVALILKILSCGKYDFFNEKLQAQEKTLQEKPYQQLADAGRDYSMPDWFYDKLSLHHEDNRAFDLRPRVKIMDRSLTSPPGLTEVCEAIQRFYRDGGHIEKYIQIDQAKYTMDELYRADPNPSRKGRGYPKTMDVPFCGGDSGEIFTHGYLLDGTEPSMLTL